MVGGGWSYCLGECVPVLNSCVSGGFSVSVSARSSPFNFSLFATSIFSVAAVSLSPCQCGNGWGSSAPSVSSLAGGSVDVDPPSHQVSIPFIPSGWLSDDPAFGRVFLPKACSLVCTSPSMLALSPVERFLLPHTYMTW